MTVIAAHNHSGCGVVVGDILTSGPYADRLPEVRLPTQGNVSDFFDGAIGVRKPAQKVCIVSDDCAIAWAGRLDYARAFVRRLKRLSVRIKITKEIVAQLFQKCAYDDFQIAGAIYVEGSMQTFGLNCEQLACPTLGKIYAGGSGASIVDDYVRIVSQLKLAPPSAGEVAARGVSLALTQVAHLLNAEFRKGSAADSIHERFGGGYEIAAYYEGKFRKISAHFVFLDVYLKEGDLTIGNPTLVISQSYCGATLRYHVVSPYGPEDSRLRRNETIEIPPLVPQIDHCSAPVGDAPIHVACFVFVDHFRFYGEQLMSTIVRSAIPPFSYSVENSELEVFYSPTAEQDIKDFLMIHYAGQPAR